MRRKFDVFWTSLFRKYKEKEELEKHLASLQLTTYRIRKAKRNTLCILLLLSNGAEKDSNQSILKFKYYSKFVNNLFACFENMVHSHQGLMKRIPIPNTLFHGTSTTFLPSIAKEGLHPSKAGQCWIEDKYKEPRKVCLTDSLYAAEYFALVAAKEVGGEALVLKVSIEGLEDRMYIRAETLGDDGSTVFDTYFEFYFTESIPLNRIKKLYVLPKPSAYELLTLQIHCSNLSGSSTRRIASPIGNNLVVKII